MATKRITYGELENGMHVWLQGVLFTATEVSKRPTVPGMHETLKPENHTTVRFKGLVVNDKGLKNTAYDGGVYGGYSWVLITVEDAPEPAASEGRKVKIVAQFGPEYSYVSDSQDTAPIKDAIAGAKDYDAFFVLAVDGDYTEVWGMVGIVPFRSKLVSRLL
jgi:hypothetical protein